MTDLRQRVPVGGLSDVGGEVICLDDEGVIEEGVDVGLLGEGGGSSRGYYYYDDGSEDTSESETTSDEEGDDVCGGRGGCGGCWEEDECCFEMVGCCAGGYGLQAGGGRGGCGIGFGCEVGGRMTPRDCGGERGRKCKECETGKKCKTCEKRRKKKKKGKGFWSKLYPVKKLGEWGGDVVGVSRCPGEVGIPFSVAFLFGSCLLRSCGEVRAETKGERGLVFVFECR
ncbi:hypothetical protein CABS01_03157 [Colletotrichum abscissum]|uniref:uncharacterized protein n=1 Tax=Colletotrichum abscissum TaxID=1671311 RepID=UPI0027D623AB|nr:uncharacterized protein CABS01_03157 [Colletotrichum abscissum]KAK1477855.1 hypothetical protein CABS01_03157 [Colletotrichum abscissum]